MSSSIESAADDEMARPIEPDRITELAGELDDLAEVSDVELLADREPTRLEVTLAEGEVPEAVEDRIEKYDADMEHSGTRITEDNELVIVLTTPERFRIVTSREIRPYGSSIALTFPPDSIKLADFDKRENLVVRARDGAVLLTRASDE